MESQETPMQLSAHNRHMPIIGRFIVQVIQQLGMNVVHESSVKKFMANSMNK